MKKTPKNLQPKFILCEDARVEAFGKLSLLGVYVGERIFVFPNKEALPKELKAVAVFGPLTFVVTIYGKRSKQPTRFELVAPGGKSIAGGPLAAANSQKDITSTLVAKLIQIAVPKWGKYIARFSFGKSTLEFPFEIAAAPAGTKVPQGFGT